jgi:hypothetical protein
MWREQCFLSEITEIKRTNLLSGLVTAESSHQKRANLFLSLRYCAMVWPLMGGACAQGCHVRSDVRVGQWRTPFWLSLMQFPKKHSISRASVTP